MTLFTNSNFIHHIVTAQGLQSNIDRDQYPLLQTLIELESRLLLETAAKFMRRDRRDVLTLEDLELALKEQGHHQLAIAPLGLWTNREESTVREDRLHTSAGSLMEEQLKEMGNRQLEGPRLTGRWVYLRGRVPSTGENLNIKRLEQLKESGKHEWQEKRRLCNIIRDDPYSYLTAEQSDYFLNVTRVISTDSGLAGISVDGNLTSLVPFLLKFLGAAELNETGISYLLRLLDNRFVWRSLQFAAVKSLSLLLAYKGPQALAVGVKIAQMVQRLSEKYPVLRDIFEGYEDGSYSTVLKRIPFQLYLGVPFELSQEFLEKCKSDAEGNDPMAVLCLRALLEYAGQLSLFRGWLAKRMGTYVYWHPCPELKEDPYLRMF